MFTRRRSARPLALPRPTIPIATAADGLASARRGGRRSPRSTVGHPPAPRGEASTCQRIPMRLAILTAALGLALAGGAAAAPPYPGERPPTARETDAVAVAVAFWHARGLDARAICPRGLDVLEADDLTDTDVADGFVMGRAATCRLWVISGIDRFERLCLIVTHEVGHALGIGHSPDGLGIMGAEPTEVPWSCQVRARVRAQARARARNRAQRRDPQPAQSRS
jgi:hypothetical protein